LFGAMKPAQVEQNANALRLADQLEDAQLAELLAIGSPAT
jgi:hypothetical protein